MFKNYPKLSDVIKDRFKFIFIDEYQDTHKEVIEIFLDLSNACEDLPDLRQACRFDQMMIEARIHRRLSVRFLAIAGQCNQDDLLERRLLANLFRDFVPI